MDVVHYGDCRSRRLRHLNQKALGNLSGYILLFSMQNMWWSCLDKHSYSPILNMQIQLILQYHSLIAFPHVSEAVKPSPPKVKLKVQMLFMKALQGLCTALWYYLALCPMAADTFSLGSEDVKICRALSATWKTSKQPIEKKCHGYKMFNIAWPQCLRAACESSGCSWGTGGSHRLCWWCLQAQTLCHPQPSVSAQCLGSPATGLEAITSNDSCHLPPIPNTATNTHTHVNACWK